MAGELKPYVERVNYDHTQAGKVEEALRRTLSDGGALVLDGDSDANLADYVAVALGIIASAMTKAKALGKAADEIEKVVDFTINGKTIAIDLATNEISSNDNIDAIADGLAAALIAGGTGILIGALGTGIAATVGLATVGFFAGNYISSWAPDILSNFFGADVSYTFDAEKQHTLMRTNASLDYVLRDHWDNGSDADMKYYYEHGLTFEFQTTHPQRSLYFYFDGKTKTFDFKNTTSQDLFKQEGEIEELLKYLPEKPFLKVKTSDLKEDDKLIIIETNYLSQDTSPAEIYDQIKSGDKNALYSAISMQPYVLDTDNVNVYNKDDYSDKFLQKRSEYLYWYAHQESIPGSTGYYDNKYIDTDYQSWAHGGESSLFTLEKIFLGISTNDNKVIFGSDNANSSAQMQGGDGNDYLFGMGGDDNILGGIIRRSW